MKTKNSVDRHSFSRIKSVLEMPDLLDVQLSSFAEFIQMDVPPDKRERVGLQSVFLNVFPILDNREEARIC